MTGIGMLAPGFGACDALNLTKATRERVGAPSGVSYAPVGRILTPAHRPRLWRGWAEVGGLPPAARRFHDALSSATEFTTMLSRASGFGAQSQRPVHDRDVPQSLGSRNRFSGGKQQ